MKMPMSKASFFMGHGKKMDVVCDLTSDEEVEDFQHWDNFTWHPTHFNDYYDATRRNYQYPFQY